MPNEGEGNDPGPQEQGARAWQNQGRQARSYRGRMRGEYSP